MDIFLPEMIGTMLLIIFGDGVVANVVLSKNKGQNSGWIVIATGWAMAVFIGVFAVGGYTGAHINPAVTIGLLAIGKITFDKAVVYIIGQFVGAFIGGVIVWLAYYQHFGETEDKGLKLAVFCTGPAIRNTGWNLVTEIIGTFTLLYGVLALGPALKGVAGAGAAASVAFLVWGIGLSLGGPTGYAINPARDLGPRIAHAVLPIAGKGSSDWGYSWIPVVGPIIGGILGALLYNATLGALPAPTP
ncbi:MAG: aquaporin family protein [Verrucomicrobia bacterium]|nr:aquaporin family protein [Verrucomicrobiota bacterium]